MTTNTEVTKQKEEIGMLLSKASGIVRVISLGLLDGRAKFDETLLPDINASLWAAYDHIDEARKILGVDDEQVLGR